MTTSDSDALAALCQFARLASHADLVMAVEVECGLRKRLVEMGVTPGVLIAVERVAPLGDPIAVEVRGYRLSMRKAEAANIRVKWRPGLI